MDLYVGLELKPASPPSVDTLRERAFVPMLGAPEWKGYKKL